MKRTTQNKLMLHGSGTGDLGNDDVEKRAREIAVIRGRSADRVAEEDRAEAFAELEGSLLPDTTGRDAGNRGALSRDPSEPVADSGHEVVTDNPTEDDEDARERLATEGVEEAQHDQMLAAREKEHRQDRA
jgi:hypothetical protein